MQCVSGKATHLKLSADAECGIYCKHIADTKRQV